MTNNLTYEELHRQFTYDPLTGLFIRNTTTAPNACKGEIAGTKKDGYIQISINHTSYYAHRLAWFYYYGYMPEGLIDHRDRIRHHNWILNLRESSNQCNIRNTGNRSDNTSGIKGVFWDTQKNKWASVICINQKRKHLGFYEDFDDAVCARLAGEQCVNWASCDSTSPAYLYVKENIQGVKNI